MTAPVLGRGIPTASIIITTGNPPPSTAAKPGHPDPGINLPDTNGRTPLLAELTMAKPDPDKIAALLGAGASVTSTLPTGENALTYAIANNHTPQIIAILIDQAIADKGADLPDAKGVTPLFAAVRTQDLDTIVNLVINAGASLEQVSAKGETPMMVASRKRLAGAQELLVKLGADVVPAWNEMLPETKEALILSIAKPPSNLAGLMLDYAIDSAKGSMDLLMVCLVKGFRPTSPESRVNGRKILAPVSSDLYPLACKRAEAGDTRFLLALIEFYRRNPSVCDGCSRLTYAIRNHPSIVPAILSVGDNTDVIEADGNGDFPLIIAAEMGDVEMVKLLLANGGKLDDTNWSKLGELARSLPALRDALEVGWK